MTDDVLLTLKNVSNNYAYEAPEASRSKPYHRCEYVISCMISITSFSNEYKGNRLSIVTLLLPLYIQPADTQIAICIYLMHCLKECLQCLYVY